MKKLALIVIFLLVGVAIIVIHPNFSGNERTPSSSPNVEEQGTEPELESEPLISNNHTVLYIGHSFGKIFADTLEDHAEMAGVTNHIGYRVTSGDRSGAPDALWEDTRDLNQIKAYLDTGEIDVLIMICCSVEFIESSYQSDLAVWNFTSYAVEKNPEIRIGLAMPWKDFPAEYDNGTEYRNQTDIAYDGWVNLSANLSSDFPATQVFTINHGAVMYDLRDMFEAGDLGDDVEDLIGGANTSIFRDEKGHAGQIGIDTGTLVWLHAVYGIEPITTPEFEQYEFDIRQIAQNVISEGNQ